MSEIVMLLTPLLVLIILAVVRFTGCSSFTSAPDPPKTVTGPPLVIAPPDAVPPPTTPVTYEDTIKNTAGFAALWPLNETGGNVANVVGPLNPGANGVYTTRGGVPAGSGYTIGKNGVLFHKDSKDFAPLFDGTASYVEVPFNGPLNPVKTVPGFTIELWVKPDPAFAGATQVVLSSHRFDAANNQQGFEIALIKNAAQPNHQIRGRVFGNAAAGQAIAQPLQGDPAEWRHIVFTYEISPTQGPTVTMQVRLAKSAGPFKDGPHSCSYESVITAKSSTLRFGAGHGMGQSPDNFFSGQIDNVAFYNAVLPQSEIDKHFNMF